MKWIIFLSAIAVINLFVAGGLCNQGKYFNMVVGIIIGIVTLAWALMAAYHKSK